MMRSKVSRAIVEWCQRFDIRLEPGPLPSSLPPFYLERLADMLAERLAFVPGAAPEELVCARCQSPALIVAGIDPRGMYRCTVCHFRGWDHRCADWYPAGKIRSNA